MKRFIAILLLFSTVASLTACKKQEKPVEPVTFYYRRAEVTYDGTADVISSEQREAKGHVQEIDYLLKEYLKGPISEELTHFVPENVKLVKFSTNNDSAQVLLSDGFARLSGMDLTVTCACITLTVIELTNVNNVQISTQNVPLNNQPHITMNKDCLKLLDSTPLNDLPKS